MKGLHSLDFFYLRHSIRILSAGSLVGVPDRSCGAGSRWIHIAGIAISPRLYVTYANAAKRSEEPQDGKEEGGPTRPDELEGNEAVDEKEGGQGDQEEGREKGQTQP
ncbi:MAG: hypothetical protein H0X44_00820 [Acidobacteria bacterium]|nr:hypothetical protein [Acidobacteriota bacterium]